MKLTSKELFDLNIVDEIIDEPIGGAHRDREKTLENIRISIKQHLESYETLNEEKYQYLIRKIYNAKDIFVFLSNYFLTLGELKVSKTFSSTFWTNMDSEFKQIIDNKIQNISVENISSE